MEQRQLKLKNAEYVKEQIRRPESMHEFAILRKHEVGGMMNQEEARMNRNLLKEIATKRKSQRAQSQHAFDENPEDDSFHNYYENVWIFF